MNHRSPQPDPPPTPPQPPSLRRALPAPVCLFAEFPLAPLHRLSTPTTSLLPSIYPTTLLASLTLTSWPILILCLALTLIILLITIKRRPDLRTTPRLLILAALLLLSLAASGLTWLQPHPYEIAVMVDLSPSTRTAQFRNPTALRRRINQLLGPTPHRILYFASENHASIPDSAILPDLPADRTTFSPPNAPAILLFSDAQFPLPATSPPVYIAIDPLLQDPPDSAVKRLELRGQTLATTLLNQSTQSRPFSLTPSTQPTAQLATPGSTLTTTPLPQSAPNAAARLHASDPWPENDALSILIPPPTSSQLWWVGSSPPTSLWTPFTPPNLPTQPADYLAPSLIVLDNLPAPALSDLHHQRLTQYVRDLGGSLVILGGDHAFAAGDYPGTPLDSLSPIASSPPTPTIHWIILADSSGSMAAADNGPTRFQHVTAAILKLLPHLPPEDPLTIGSFAENLRFWSTGKTARQTASLSLPPPDIKPNGPTNLEDALLKLIAASDSAMPKQLLLLTDADAIINDLPTLRRGLIDKKIRLDLLALRDDGRALAALENLAKATAGQSLRELSPAKWTQAIHRLYSLASPHRLVKSPAPIRFLADLASSPSRTTPLYNRTWLKKDATALADTTTPEGVLPLAARWNVGAGHVVALAFPPTPAEAQTIARLFAQSPRDPRFKITWTPSQDLHLTIDAIDGPTYLNGLSFTLELSATPQRLPIPQTAPGRYELRIDAPRKPTFATVYHDSRTLDRTAIAGRYPPEFESIGNNTDTMKTLTSRFGGQLISPRQTTPIAFPFPAKRTPLTSPLAATGAALIAASLLLWRLT